MTTIDMQTMRYINLLSRVSSVKTTRCFVYNNTIIFAVPSVMMSKAIGPNGRNVRILQETLEKRVKIVRSPDSIADVQQFVRDIVEPVGFKSIELRDGGVLLTAGGQSKAALIGRNKKRLEELSKIIEDSFGKVLKIV